MILIDGDAALLDDRKKLTKCTNDFADARNWLSRVLSAFRGDQYFAVTFDHKEKRSVIKEKGQGKSDLLRFCVPDSDE